MRHPQREDNPSGESPAWGTVVQDRESESVSPYHLINISDGALYIYFLERDCAFYVSKVTYDLLRIAMHCSLEEAAARLRLEGGHEVAQITRSLDDAVRLRTAGFMRTPVNRLPDEVKERQLEHRFSTPRTRLELALAESCNLACTYCYCSAVRDMPNRGLMSEEVAREAIDWLFEASDDEPELAITLFGGEPLTNKATFQFVMDYSDALAKDRGKVIRYSMTTNGTLLDDMVIHYIKKHNFGLMVSLDGPPEIHDAQCPTQGGGPSFEMATKGIKKLMRRRRRVTVRCTVTNARPNMLALVKYFEEFGFTRIVLGPAQNPPCPSPADCSHEDLMDFQRQKEEDLLPWMFDALRNGRIPPWFPYGSILAAPEPDPDTIKPLSLFRCGACRGTMTVGADGRLYPCHRFVGMRNFVIGHICTGPDAEMAKDFWRRYDTAIDDHCSKCWARRLCNRPCPWVVAQQNGGFKMQSSRRCSETQAYCEEGIHMQWCIPREFPEITNLVRGNGRSLDVS